MKGRFNRGFLALRVWGAAYIFFLEWVIHKGAYFRNFTVVML